MNEFFRTYKNIFSNELQDKKDEKKSTSYNIFFISCFLDNLWSHNITLQSKNNEIKIENLFVKKLVFGNKTYRAIVHKIKVINIKKLDLYIITADNKYNWCLNEIELQEKAVLFDDLEINPRYYDNLLNYISNLNCDKTNIYYNLKDIEKLKIFLEFFTLIYYEFLINKYDFDKIVQINLVEKFIEISQSKNEFEYSFLLDIFNMSFGTEKIDNFLDVFDK